MKPATETTELIKILELRKATLELIVEMEATGWLPSGGQSYSELDNAFGVLWNEYAKMYESLRGENAKSWLFGNMKFTSGQLIQTKQDMQNLMVGDIFINSTNHEIKVLLVDKKHNRFFYKQISGKQPSSNTGWVECNNNTSMWTYLRREL